MKNIIKVAVFILAVVVAALISSSHTSDRQYIREGNKFYRQHAYDKAETQYRKALEANSGNTQALYNLGCALMQQGKDSLAASMFEQAGKAENAKLRRAMAYHNIGVIFQKRQQYSPAAEAYKESLRNNPNDDETRYNLALCLRQKKDEKQDEQQQQQKQQQHQEQKEQEQQNQQNQQNSQGSQQQQSEQMSKDNAEQLLNYAVQEEKATQQRMKEKARQSSSRRLEKNW